METFVKLKKWLGINDKLGLFDRDERGIYTTESIVKGSIIIKIKPKYLLEYQQIYSIYPIDNIIEANSLVAFYLTKLFIEKDEFWLPYIKTLPEDLTNFPYFWNEKELKYLKNTSFFTSIETNYQTHIETIQSDFDIIYDYNVENSIIPNINKDDFFDIYIRFRILVGSRIFGYQKFGNETSGMVPYIDLLNHSSEPNTVWTWDDLSNHFVLIAIKNINKGEELTDNYGNKNNIELLLYYGFTIGSNSISILSFDINNVNYSFDSHFDLVKLNQFSDETKNKIKQKLEKILSQHMKNLFNISNKNIINIYNDEIKIIKLLLVNLTT